MHSVCKIQACDIRNFGSSPQGLLKAALFEMQFRKFSPEKFPFKFMHEKIKRSGLLLARQCALTSGVWEWTDFGYIFCFVPSFSLQFFPFISLADLVRDLPGESLTDNEEFYVLYQWKLKKMMDLFSSRFFSLSFSFLISMIEIWMKIEFFFFRWKNAW